MAETLRKIMTAAEVMAETGMKRTPFYTLARADALPFRTLRLGRKYAFSRVEFEQWLNGSKSGGDEPAPPSGSVDVSARA